MLEWLLRKGALILSRSNTYRAHTHTHTTLVGLSLRKSSSPMLSLRFRMIRTRCPRRFLRGTNNNNRHTWRRRRRWGIRQEAFKLRSVLSEHLGRHRPFPLPRFRYDHRSKWKRRGIGGLPIVGNLRLASGSPPSLALLLPLQQRQRRWASFKKGRRFRRRCFRRS